MCYKLVNKKPVKCSIEEWTEYFNTEDRIVAYDEKDGIRVSTVFLGSDHNHSGRAPILFESMVFGTEEEYEPQMRYRSYEGAEEGHKQLVKKYL